MHIKDLLSVLVLSIIAAHQFGCHSNGSGTTKGGDMPNIVLIVSDDQGYADVSYHDHPPEVATPAIDKLAGEGVVFTSGYASAYVCAPTRAGLLTGRYQQRFGFYTASDSRQGLPLSEKLLPELLKEKGYRTGIFGKWHLGIEPDYHPLKRGFDTFYGFLGHGAHDYFDLTCTEDRKHNCIYRDEEIINDEGYLTDNLGREACHFIEKCVAESKPFFLYLPFNAVHWPLQAPEEDVQRFNTGNGERDILMAMLYRMDIAVDRVLQTLKETGQYNNSLMFYFSDNGGARRNHSDNSPLRDFKQSTYEGGIRVPFFVTWPGAIPAGTEDTPVISLDIMPTICDVLGIPLPEGRIYDGRSLVAVLHGNAEVQLHDRLFWDGNDGHWAVRDGDWKLVLDRQKKLGLFNLKEDTGETHNRVEDHPELVRELQDAYTQWRSAMAAPMTGR